MRATRAATLAEDGLSVVLLLRRRGIVNAACRGVGVVATRVTRAARLAAVRIAAVDAKRRAWRGSIVVYCSMVIVTIPGALAKRLWARMAPLRT